MLAEHLEKCVPVNHLKVTAEFLVVRSLNGFINVGFIKNNREESECRLQYFPKTSIHVLL